MSAIPRPGDKVTWYENHLIYTGDLIGHTADGRPYILNQFGTFSKPNSFDCVRLYDRDRRVGPNWTELPDSARIFRATESEIAQFDRLLSQITPPGPKYIDLVQEIWERGFEIFLVGGTVRDVLAGKPSSDVDLITTMPLSRGGDLLRSMYDQPQILDDATLNSGHLRLGIDESNGSAFGDPSRDPYIDLGVFQYSQVGTASAVFGSNIVRDMGHRDFTCNAVYYDPLNQVLIDPTGRGVRHAQARELDIVCDRTLRSRFHLAQIAIRFIKFRSRGFEASAEIRSQIRTEFVPALKAMHDSVRIAYFKAQFLDRLPRSAYQESFDRARTVFAELEAMAVWDELIEPLRKELI